MLQIYLQVCALLIKRLTLLQQIECCKFANTSFDFIQSLIIQKMGVCVGACARLPNNGASEIEIRQKQQIKHEIEPKPADMINTSEENTNQNPKQPTLEKSAQSKPSEADHHSDNNQVNEVQAHSQADSCQQVEQKNERPKQVQEVCKYFIGRGKTPEDNELIRQMISANGLIKMPLIQLDNGISYEGEWLNGQRQGHGVQVWSDNSKYVGQWKNNKANGRGILYHSDGDKYDGQWLDDKASGFGTYTHNNGAQYIGEWKEDKQWGRGKQIWTDGQIYEGEYQKGLKNGLGLLKFADGNYYEGQFTDNEIHGKGTYVWIEKKTYSGQWKHNQMSGNGKMVWKDGRSYQGNHFGDKMHGFGVFRWPDGRRYEGQWEDGKQHGKGDYILSNGESKSGEWCQGKKIKWIQNKQNIEVKATK